MAGGWRKAHTLDWLVVDHDSVTLRIEPVLRTDQCRRKGRHDDGVEALCENPVLNLSVLARDRVVRRGQAVRAERAGDVDHGAQNRC